MRVVAASDAELVSASLAGDRDAFAQIVSRYQSLVCSLAYSATGSLSQSEDLGQETFLTAWKKLAELRDPGKLRGWLCGIAKNLVSNWLRTQGREPSHEAVPLEEVSESLSPEPLPVERAINREEAEILWRSLERIPETYRVPLVLFYREHQSVGVVAQSLELTEDAVKQRLSRGRKLLQEEVLAFVETALEKSSPGRAFTLGVVAALPMVVSSASAASAAGLAVAKGGAGAKTMFSFAALGGLFAMLGAILFTWKTAIDETKSARERRFVKRTAWIQVAFFILSLGVSVYWLPRLMSRPWIFSCALAAILLANVANAFVLLTYVVRRRMEIGLEEGTLVEMMPASPGAETNRKAARNAVKQTVPLLLMVAAGVVYLPWKEHWGRSAVVTAGEVLVLVWAFRRYREMQSFKYSPRLSKAFMRHPLLLLPVVLLIPVVLGGVLGYALPFFLHPEWTGTGISFWPGLRSLGIALLAGGVVLGIFALLFGAKRKLFPGLTYISDRLPSYLKQSFRPEQVLQETYRPLFEQLMLTQEQAAGLRDLILQNLRANVAKTMPLLNQKLEPSRRAALLAELAHDRKDFDARIQEFLGHERYEGFRRYDQTIPDRTLLNQLRGKLTGTNAPLSRDQQARLLQALTHARSEYPWTTDLGRRKYSPDDYAAMLTKANLDTFALEEEQFAQQFLAPAERLLTPEQLAVFDELQTKQRRSKSTEFKMAARLFAPEAHK